MPPQFENQITAPKSPNQSFPKWAKILIVFIIVACIGFIAWFVLVNRVCCVLPAEETENIVATDPTADWQTYRNEEYGFEIKYPKMLIAQESDQIEFGENSPQILFSMIINSEDRPSFGSFTIRVFKNDTRDLEAWIKKYEPKTVTGATLLRKVEDVSLYGRLAKKLDIFAFDGMQYSIAAIVNGNVFEVSYYDFGANDPLQSEHSYLNNQILSTFKFIEPKTSEKTRYLPVGVILEWTKDTKWNFDPPNTFITYSNTDEGFSFQIPFNENWGTDEIKLKPYEVTPDGAVYFGNVSVSCEGGCVMGKDTHVYVNNHQSAESVIADLNNNKNYREGVFVVKPTIVSLGDLKAVEYEYGELGSEKFVIVIGKKFNYVFRASNVEIKDLEKTAKTIKFIE